LSFAFLYTTPFNISNNLSFAFSKMVLSFFILKSFP